MIPIQGVAVTGFFVRQSGYIPEGDGEGGGEVPPGIPGGGPPPPPFDGGDANRMELYDNILEYNTTGTQFSTVSDLIVGNFGMIYAKPSNYFWHLMSAELYIKLELTLPTSTGVWIHMPVVCRNPNVAYVLPTFYSYDIRGLAGTYDPIIYSGIYAPLFHSFARGPNPETPTCHIGTIDNNETSKRTFVAQSCDFNSVLLGTFLTFENAVVPSSYLPVMNAYYNGIGVGLCRGIN